MTDQSPRAAQDPVGSLLFLPQSTPTQSTRLFNRLTFLAGGDASRSPALSCSPRPHNGTWDPRLVLHNLPAPMPVSPIGRLWDVCFVGHTVEGCASAKHAPRSAAVEAEVSRPFVSRRGKLPSTATGTRIFGAPNPDAPCMPFMPTLTPETTPM